VVSHVLYEGLRLATKQPDGSNTPFTGDIRFGLSDPQAGAHVNALVYEAKIMSEFTGKKENLRQSIYNSGTGMVTFKYTTVQYDVFVKTQTSANPNSVTVDKITKTTPTSKPTYP